MIADLLTQKRYTVKMYADQLAVLPIFSLFSSLCFFNVFELLKHSFWINPHINEWYFFFIIVTFCWWIGSIERMAGVCECCLQQGAKGRYWKCEENCLCYDSFDLTCVFFSFFSLSLSIIYICDIIIGWRIKWTFHIETRRCVQNCSSCWSCKSSMFISS